MLDAVREDPRRPDGNGGERELTHDLEEATMRAQNLPPRTWGDAATSLMALASADLDAGSSPVPTLAVFDDDEPLGLAVLRPFAPGEVVQALIEVLALFVPLGTDRLALALPGRAWSTRDPIVPVSDDADLRQPVVVLISADAHDGPCELRTTIHPYRTDARGWRWEPPVGCDEPPEAPVVTALRVLLDQRDGLRGAGPGADLAIATQLSRVLLRGHQIALAPRAAELLEHATGR